MSHLVKLGFNVLQNRIAFLLLVFALPAIFALWLLYGPLTDESKRMPAPNFNLRDLNGRLASLSSYEGKTILINFWATWCVPCLKEIPDLVKLQRSIKTSFTVVGIAVASGEADDVKQFAKDHGMNYPILLDPDQKSYHQFRLIGLPASFLVDRRGRVVKSYVGPQKYEKFRADIGSVVES